LRFTDGGFIDPLRADGANVTYPITLDVPTVSWPIAAARNTKSGKLYGVSLGGEGYLYSFDPVTSIWVVESSMKGADASGMIYASAPERLVIVITGLVAPDGTALLFYGPDRKKTKTPLDMTAFAGLTDIYDPGNGPSPGLQPIATADNQLLVVTGGGIGRRPRNTADLSTPYRAYLIDLTTGAASLVSYNGSAEPEPEPW
jgi:hypothetical protein